MLNKNKLFSFLMVLFIAFPVAFFAGCNDDDDDEYVGNWFKRSDFEGHPRSEAVSFTVGNYAYVGTGYDGTDRLVDIWRYDAEKDTWIQIADMPGAPRNSAVAFGTSTKGYVGQGYDGINKMKDFYEYDPQTNEWAQIADFGGSARYGAVAFSVNNKGYVGSGFDGNYLKDFWEYDPSTGAWTQKISIGGAKRMNATAFVINNKGYVATGISNGSYVDDFWVFDPSNESWTKLKSISDATDESFDDEYAQSIIGVNKVSFVIKGKAYIATAGLNSVGKIVWEYDPSTDLWEQKTSFEGSDRTEAVAFSIGDRGYVVSGRSSSYYFDDIWEFFPFDEYNEYD